MKLGADDLGGWQIVKSVPNPWGKIPLTAGGKSLTQPMKDYVARLAETSGQPDNSSRKHHYVPRAYLRAWSFDNKRIWTHDTATGVVKPLGLRAVCMAENFHRVVGGDGEPHNRVESLFTIVENELVRVQRLLNALDDPADLEFDDLMGLGLSMAVQRMRTLQERRLMSQHSAWLAAQNANDFTYLHDGAADPYRLAGMHTEAVFAGMWDAADLLTTRYIEIWHDEQGRFTTCDAPVLVPMRGNKSPGLNNAPFVFWPISPNRVVALSHDSTGLKGTLRAATNREVGVVRRCVEQGRERMIFASAEQRDRLDGKVYRRRTQVHLRCSQYGPRGDYIEPPGCCVEYRACFADKPDVRLCAQGLHSEAPNMLRHT